MSIFTKELLFCRFSHFSFPDLLEGKFSVLCRKVNFLLRINLEGCTIHPLCFLGTTHFLRDALGISSKVMNTNTVGAPMSTDKDFLTQAQQCAGFPALFCG